jgi:hypothetical protein
VCAGTPVHYEQTVREELSDPTMAQTECLVQREPRAWQEDVCPWRGEDRNAMLEGLRAGAYTRSHFSST